MTDEQATVSLAIEQTSEVLRECATALNQANTLIAKIMNSFPVVLLAYADELKEYTVTLKSMNEISGMANDTCKHLKEITGKEVE